MNKKFWMYLLCLILLLTVFYKPIETFIIQPIHAQEKESPILEKVIVFLGDSITAYGKWNEYFPNAITINHGIRRNKTSDVLWRLDPVIQNKPDQLFLMIGINDLIQGVPEKTLIDNYSKIITDIRGKSPKTKVYVQSILPVNTAMVKFPLGFSDKIIRVNKEIKEIAKMNGCTYIDLYSIYSEGNVLPQAETRDGLHLTDQGYRKWINEIEKYIN